MGILRFALDLNTLRKAQKYIDAFWETANNKSQIEKSSVLTNAFNHVINLRIIGKAFQIAARQGNPDAIDNIFTFTANNIPKEDNITLARHIADSDVFSLISEFSASIAMQTLAPMAENCPPQDKIRMLSILENSGKLKQTLPHAQHSSAVKFYSNIFKETSSQDAINQLQRLESWNALDHHDNQFVEWVYETDERLAPAVIK